MTSSNTARNSTPPGKPFAKGDPRINRKGRPRSADALRELARSISHEPVMQNGQPLVIDGHVVTVAEAKLRQLAASKNTKDIELFLKIAFGLPTQTVELSGKDGGPVEQVIRFEWSDENDSHPDSDA